MSPHEYGYITQFGWLQRATSVHDEPSITIPLSWLGLEEGDGHAYPEVVAAYFRAYRAMHAVSVSASTEVLMFSLKRKQDAALKLDESHDHR